ncbi:hypothetical protein GGI24_002476, partial [Coemansia furcata]
MDKTNNEDVKKVGFIHINGGNPNGKRRIVELDTNMKVSDVYTLIESDPYFKAGNVK